MSKLTKQSKKWVIGICVVVAVLLIGAVMYSVASAQYGYNPVPLLMIVIVVLGIIAAAIAVYFRVRRSKYVSMLHDDYYEAYESIMIGIRNTTLSTMEQKDILLDMADLMLQAQQDGRAVADVIDTDMEQFIKKIIKAHGYRNTFVFNFLYGLQNAPFVLVIVQLAVFLSRGNESFFDTTIGVMILPYLIVMVFVLLPLVRYFITKQKMLWLFIAPALLVAAYITFNKIVHTYGMNLAWVRYLDSEVKIIGSLEVLIILVLVFVGTFILKAWMRRRAFKTL